MKYRTRSRVVDAIMPRTPGELRLWLGQEPDSILMDCVGLPYYVYRRAGDSEAGLMTKEDFEKQYELDSEEAALRTDLSIERYGVASGRLSPERNGDCVRMMPLHAAIGLCTETGELMDGLKKMIFYGAELDVDNLIEEGGDISWYLRLLAAAIGRLRSGVTFESMIADNVNKLKRRYPDRFTEEAARERADKRHE